MSTVDDDTAGDKGEEAVNERDFSRQLLLALLHQVSRYFHLDDAGVYLFALAVAVSTFLDGDPLWGMIVGPASSGKTEVLRALARIATRAVDTLTIAGLLNWHRWRPQSSPIPKGILVDLGDCGLITIADFSTVLHGNRNNRDETFSFLRRVYDGEVRRDLANGDGGPLTWQGRVTFLACCTSDIDNFAAHSDALGPRWVYLRQLTRDLVVKRSVLDKARKTHQVDAGREIIARWAEMLIVRAAVAAEEVQLSDEDVGMIEDAALVAAFGRGSVPRDNFRREIDGIPESEEPTRLAKQLTMLARCSVALGLTASEAVALASRVALDSIPRIRERVLTAVSEAEVSVDAATVARSLNYDPKTVMRALQDFQALGIVEPAPMDNAAQWGAAAAAVAGEVVGGSKPWRVAAEHLDMIRRVMEARKSPILHELPGQP